MISLYDQRLLEMLVASRKLEDAFITGNEDEQRYLTQVTLNNAGVINRNFEPGAVEVIDHGTSDPGRAAVLYSCWAAALANTGEVRAGHFLQGYGQARVIEKRLRGETVVDPNDADKHE